MTSPQPVPDPIVSPCIAVCSLDATGQVCLGCHRTIDEITAWSTLTPAERRAVLQAVAARNSPQTQEPA